MASNSAIVGVLRALLVADTAGFEKAMSGASKEVADLAKTLGKDLEPRQRAINNLVREFLGGREIQKAEEYAKAIEHLGGVSQLTAKDQEKVNRVVGEALEHYKALGVQAPASLQKIFDSTQKTEKGTSLLGGAFGRMTAAFTAAGLIDKAIGGLIDLGKGAFEAASHIVDLSQKTGLSTTAVQKYGFVANQTGNTVDNFSDSVFKLGVNMEKGGKDVVHGLKGLGLELEHIRALKPEDQFDAIMRALAAIEDPQERNRLGVELMGKSYANVASSVEEYIDLMAKAPAASEASVRATDAAADAIGRAWDTAKSTAINAIGSIFLALENAIRDSERAQRAGTKPDIRKPGLVGTGIFLAGDEFGGGFTAGLDPNAMGMPVQPRAGNFGKDQKLAIDGITSALMTNAEAVRLAKMELAGLTKAQRDEIDAGLERKLSIEEVIDGMHRQNTAFDLSADAQQLYSSTEKQLAKGETEAARAAKQHAEEIKKLADTFSRTALNQKVDDLVEAFDLASSTAAVSGKQLQTFGKALFDLAMAGAKVPPQFELLIRDQAALNFSTKVNVKSTKELTSGTTNYADALKKTKPSISDVEVEQEQLNRTLEDAFNNTTDMVKKNADWRGSLQLVANGFEQLANISGSSMSAISRGVGTMVSSVLQVDKSISTLAKGGWQNMLTGFTGLIGAGGAIVQLIANAFITPEWKKVMRDVGKDWGTEISEGVAKQVAESEKSIRRQLIRENFAAFGNIGRQPGNKRIRQVTGQDPQEIAELLNLSSIIADAGGLNAKNFDDWIGRAGKLFDVIALGGEMGSDATRELSTVMGLFAAQASKSGGLWSAAFKDLIQQAKNAGVAIDEVNGAISGQFDTIASGTQKIVDGFARSLDATKQNANLIVATRQDEFDRINRLTLASFNAYIAAGHTAADAAGFFGASIDALIAKQQEFGFATSGAFDALSNMRKLVSENQPLLDQVGGLNELMVALSNVGALTGETFEDLQQQGLTAFQRLTEAGFTDQQALAQLKPLLETIRKLHADTGMAIDEQTQALIDQAEDAGIIQEQIDQVQVLKDGFHEVTDAVKQLTQVIADAFGRQLPAAIEATGQAAARLKRTLGTIEIPGKGTIDRFATSATPFADGGIVTQPTFAMLGEDGPEAIIPLSRSGAASAFGGDGQVVIVLEKDGRREAEFIVPFLAGAMQRLRI